MAIISPINQPMYRIKIIGVRVLKWTDSGQQQSTWRRCEGFR